MRIKEILTTDGNLIKASLTCDVCETETVEWCVNTPTFIKYFLSRQKCPKCNYSEKEIEACKNGR